MFIVEKIAARNLSLNNPRVSAALSSKDGLMRTKLDELTTQRTVPQLPLLSQSLSDFEYLPFRHAEH